MKLVVATVVRNEATRYLASALECWRDFADEVVVLDDGSEDWTVELCRESGATVYERPLSARRMWGDEGVVRAELYGHVMAAAPDWVLWLDADMCPSSDPRVHMEGADGLAFRLYDLWGLDPLVYRCDGLWKAHERHHPWAVSARCLPSVAEARYSDRGLHSGHLPLNVGVDAYRGLEHHCVMLHYGYASRGDRLSKEDAYLEYSEVLHPVERAHALSINREPLLERLPVVPDYVLERGG